MKKHKYKIIHDTQADVYRVYRGHRIFLFFWDWYPLYSYSCPEIAQECINAWKALDQLRK